MGYGTGEHLLANVGHGSNSGNHLQASMFPPAYPGGQMIPFDLSVATPAATSTPIPTTTTTAATALTSIESNSNGNLGTHSIPLIGRFNTQPQPPPQQQQQLLMMMAAAAVVNQHHHQKQSSNSPHHLNQTGSTFPINERHRYSLQSFSDGDDDEDDHNHDEEIPVVVDDDDDDDDDITETKLKLPKSNNLIHRTKLTTVNSSSNKLWRPY